MWFFGKKKKKNSKIDEAFNRVYSRLSDIDSWEDPKKLEHYILDSCEQIIAGTKEIERRKTEYRVVTAYLNDIKTIETLPNEKSAELKDVALHICDLTRSLEAQSKITRNITEEQRLLMSEEEDDVPAIITRYKESEIYLSKIKAEMIELEGSKSDFEIEKEEVRYHTELLKKGSLVGAALCMAFILLLMFIGANNRRVDLTSAYMVAGIMATGLCFFVLVRSSTLQKRRRRANRNYNNVINMLNVVRMKYASASNGIEFIRDKYKVKSAAELEYTWEQYMEAVHDEERRIKSNDDLEYFTGRLTRILNGMNLHDRKIWLGQTRAIISEDDMAEVKMKLVGRRAKIRESMEETRVSIMQERDEIDRIMEQHDFYMPEIKEIIKSVDKMCGTGPQSRNESITKPQGA